MQRILSNKIVDTLYGKAIHYTLNKMQKADYDK